MKRRTFVAASPLVWLAKAPVVRAQPNPGFEAAARYCAAKNGVSMLVMREGQVLFEDCPNAGAPDRAWETASGTKRFCGVLAAAAAADGLLSIDEACARTLVEWTDDRRAAITVRELLTLTSGLAGGAIGRPPSCAQAVAAQPAFEPGQRFQYGPTPFQVFGEIIRRKLVAAGANPDPLAYLRQRVLDPAGIAVGPWRRGPDGMPMLPQGAALSARDWARFGQFVLDGGRGLDAKTLAACFEGTAANPGYGLSWWLLRPGLVSPGPRAGLDGVLGQAMASEDVVMAAGAGDQRLYLLRRRGLVVVRQATGIVAALMGAGTGWQDAAFLQALLG